MAEWTNDRMRWVANAKGSRLLAVIADVAYGAAFDETWQSGKERAQTVRWLATRGRFGREWGLAAEPAQRLGGWHG